MATRTRMFQAALARLVAPIFSIILLGSGCGPTYHEYWRDAQFAMMDGKYGPARDFLVQCERRRPRNVENLHDLGVCSMMIAEEKFKQMNHAAAMRELDRSIAYFNSALDDTPDYQVSIEGKNRALELKGQFEDALKQAEWTAKYVGPSAREYIFLARELEERGDKDGALLRYRQAVTMEPKNIEGYVAMAQFLIRERNEPEAVRYLQEAHTINPRDEWVVEQLNKRGMLPIVPARTAAVP